MHVTHACTRSCIYVSLVCTCVFYFVVRESLFSLLLVLGALLHQSSSFCVLAIMGKTLRRIGPKAAAMKKVKKGAKKSKVMSRGSLSVAIAEKEYQDTIQQINIILSKKKTLASRVLHMLKTNMLEPEEEPEDHNKLPGCVNKYKILSLENLRDLVKVIVIRSAEPASRFVISG